MWHPETTEEVVEYLDILKRKVQEGRVTGFGIDNHPKDSNTTNTNISFVIHKGKQPKREG